MRSEITLPPEVQATTKTRSTNASRTPPVLIEVTVRTPTGARFTRRAVAAISSGDGSPARILEWSAGDTNRVFEPPARSTALPECVGETLWITK